MGLGLGSRLELGLGLGLGLRLGPGLLARDGVRDDECRLVLHGVAAARVGLGLA